MEEKKILPVNNKAKDRLFKVLYASEENRRSLAGFLLDHEFKNAEIQDVAPVLFGNRENDLAFLCDGYLYL